MGYEFPVALDLDPSTVERYQVQQRKEFCSPLLDKKAPQ